LARWPLADILIVRLHLFDDTAHAGDLDDVAHRDGIFQQDKES